MNGKLGKLRSPVRNNYFYGKLLDEAHFTLEQDYLNQKRWLMNRLGLGAGVLCGLQLTLTEEAQLMVSPGVATDAYGREIIVPQGYCIEDPRQPTDAMGKPVGDPIEGEGAVTICLAYHECPTDYVPALTGDCDSKDGSQASSIRERFRFQVVEGLPENPAGAMTGEQCALINEDEDARGLELRDPVKAALTGACAEPDEDCVVLGTLTFGAEGEIALDALTYRQQTYSNAMLLDLILCLTERIPDDVVAAERLCLRYVRGDAQSAPAGSVLEAPLVVEVQDADGNPVEGVRVVFTARNEDAEIEGEVETNANGRARARWQLSSTPGLNTAEAVLADDCCCSVMFHAIGMGEDDGDDGEVALPVIEAVFPANGLMLDREEGAGAREIWQEQPRIELGFSEEIGPSGLLEDPRQIARWLRVFQLIPEGRQQAVVERMQLERMEPGVLGGSPFRLAYALLNAPAQPSNNFAYLVLIRANDQGRIRDADDNVLDADFAGSNLPRDFLAELWEMSGEMIDFPFNRLRISGRLPSGDGTPGGEFHSWFVVPE